MPFSANSGHNKHEAEMFSFDDGSNTSGNSNKPNESAALYSLNGNEKCLDSTRLTLISSVVLNWYEASASPAQQASRGRILLAFWLLRYGALRLSELVSLDDRKDFDFHGGTVLVNGPHAREVHMPQTVLGNIAKLVDSPMFCSRRGEILKLDPGYLRRKLYAFAELARIPKELLSPRVLRNSRAMELLQSGVQLRVVDAFLGQIQSGFDVNFIEPESTATTHMIQCYLQKEAKSHNSARNVFTGTITGIKKDVFLAEVILQTSSGLRLTAVITTDSLQNMCLCVGMVASATVKAPLVLISPLAGAKEISKKGQANAGNQFSGKVTGIKSNSVAAEVSIELFDGSHACALMGKEQVDHLKLIKGSPLLVSFNAFSIILNC